ncbi:MAG: protein kinase domain-containing protein, partial [Planctomycetota bacterium]
MRIDHAARELCCTIVYCGPALSGKDANLRHIHQMAPAGTAGDLLAQGPDSGIHLSFTLTPSDLAPIHGYRVRLAFQSVPGQSYLSSERQTILAEADAVVFVADSDRERLNDNIDALNDLFALLHNHKYAGTLPMLVQYNKRDLVQALPIEQLNPLLNPHNAPYLSATASTGVGVLETMKQAVSLVVSEATRRDDFKPADIPAPAAPTPTSAQPTIAAQTERPTVAPRTPQAEPFTLANTARLPTPMPLDSAGTAPLPPLAHTPPPADGNGPWILCCHNCQAIVEVPHAKPGEIFTCGTCGVGLEVVDGDRGITRAPQPASAAPIEEDVSSFSLQSLPSQGMLVGNALSQDPSSGPHPAIAPNQPFILEGYSIVTPLDGNQLGQRVRIRDNSTGGFFRALLLNPAIVARTGYRQLLTSTIDLARQVQHPALIQPIGLREAQGHLVVLTADAPDHEPLSHALSRRGHLQPLQATKILLQLTEALSVASRHGLAHGWLHPDCVLLDPQGRVLIDDLAIPKPSAFLISESMGASAATAHYFAPEQGQGDGIVDLRSDIFQLGALFFLMLTGDGLVTGYSAHEALHKAISSGARSSRTANAEVPREFDALCAQLTQIDRTARPGAYPALLEDIHALADGRRGGTLKLTRAIPQQGSGTVRRDPTRATAQRRNTRSVERSGRPVDRAGRSAAPATSGSGSNLLTFLIVLLALVVI